MNKLLLILPLLSFCSLSAQTTQEQADKIVIERMADETRFYSIYAKEDLQAGFEVTTTTGETLELNYPAWIFYVSYTGETNGSNTVNTSNLNQGIYIYRATINNETISGKWVKTNHN